APLRCRSVFVPTVVPCKTTISLPLLFAPEIFCMAPAIAAAGSAGVENTFRMRSVEAWSQTQSVKVPPLSMAILRGVRVGMNDDRQTRDSNMRPLSQLLPHLQTVNRIQIIARQYLQYGVAVLLVKLEGRFVVHSNFQGYIIAASL